MASPPLGDHPPPKPAPAKPLTDLDFRSGARIEELNQLIQEYEAKSSGIWDTPAKEWHRAKNLVFSLLEQQGSGRLARELPPGPVRRGQVQKQEGRLPQINRYLLLSGGIQQGTLHVDPGTLRPLSPGSDYDTDFTLLVPVLDAAGVPVTLDMKQSPPGHTRISLHPFGPPALSRWSECCSGEEAYLSAERVSDWFFRSFASCAKDVRVERRGCVTSAVLRVGTSRILYDIVPVVAFKGWPEVGESWLAQAHFWDGKLTDEEVAGGFYLSPSASGPHWRLAFSASELHLRKALPLPLVQAFRAAMAALRCKDLWGLGPYHLFSLCLWSCERLPTSYLGREENAAHALLGLLDDLLASLVHRELPSYFLPQWNLLEGLSRHALENLTQGVAQARANPASYLRQAVETAKEGKRLAKTFRDQLPSCAASEGL